MKKTYKKPEINQIRLDSQISLQLASNDNTPTLPEDEIPLTGKRQAVDPYQYEAW